MLFLNSLLWTTTAPRIPDNQSVIIYMIDSYSDPAPLRDLAQQMLSAVRAEDESLRSVEFQSLMYSDPETDTNSALLLMTRLVTGEADAFLACPESMASLTGSGAALPLDDYIAGGWLAEYDLKPCVVTLEDDETGEQTTFTAGLFLDSLDALAGMMAFDNNGACLVIASNGGNIGTTMKAVEVMVARLAEESSND